MSTTFPLPLECLQQIIRHVTHDTNGGNNTLAALLRVNKYVCSATLPILYENPFRIRLLKEDGHPKNSDILERMLTLIRLLLGSLPNYDDNDNQVTTELLRSAYLKDESESVNNPSSIPYYTFVTEVNFESHARPWESIFDNDSIDNNLDITESGEDKQSKRYLVEEVYWRFDSEECPRDAVANAIGRELRRDLTFAVVGTVAEQVRSLVIPLSDISSYLPMISRLKVLSDVTFLLDKRIYRTLKPSQELLEDEEIVLKRLKDERIRDLEAVILFVQKHQWEHPNVLSTAQDSSVQNVREKMPEEFLSRLFQALPPLLRPRFLNTHNWSQFVAKVQDTDLSFVKSISMKTMDKRLAEQDPFLHRCRSLQSISIYPWDKHLFQWAVDERKIYIDTVAQGSVPEQEPVPLRKVTIRYGGPNLGLQINDILFAFSRTLESICIETYWCKEFGLPICMGESCWDLPRLSKLSVVILEELHLRIHPEFLLRCPQLSSVHLEDSLEVYGLDRNDYWAPAELSHLELLDLQGSPAIAFHPDTLKSAPKLTRLQMKMTAFETISPYIPPEEEFTLADSLSVSGDAASNGNFSGIWKRPIWTWDWELPKLTHLLFTAEFAYRFKFKMLNGTPNLESLSLDMDSWSGDHRRVIGVTEFVNPGFQPPPSMAHLLEQEHQRYNANGQHSSPHAFLNLNKTNDPEEDQTWRDYEFVHVPRLKHLGLNGSWYFDFRGLQMLFGKVAPGINIVTMAGCFGFSIVELVESTSLNLHGLEKVFVTKYVSSEATAAAGLELIPNRTRTYRLTKPAPGCVLPQRAVYEFW